MMRLYERIILNSKLFLAVCILSATTVYLRSDENSLDNIYVKLLDGYERVTTYQAEFTQTNYWSERQITLNSEGRIYIAGEKLVLIYRQPQSQRVIIDEFVYIIDETEKSLIITDVQEEVSPIKVITTFWGDSEVELISSDDESIVIELQPQDYSDISIISAIINRDNFLITFIEYEDNDGNRVEFRFKEPLVNKDIDENAFALPDISDYTVLDQR